MSNATALVEQHIAAKKRLKLVRVIGPLVMVLVVVINIWGIVEMFTSLDTEKFTKSLETEAERVMPRVQTSLLAAARRIQPLIGEEFQRYQKEVGPQIEARLNREIKALEDSANETLATALADALRKASQRQRSALLKEFPTLKGDVTAQNEILEAAKAGAEEWAKGELTSSLNGHVAAMTRIRDTLNTKFGGAAGAQEPTQLMMAYLGLMADTIGGEETIMANEPRPEAEPEAKSGKGGN